MSKAELVLVLSIGVLLAAACPGSAQSLEALAAGAPGWGDYPGDDALVLHEEIALTLHPDGRVERYTRHVRKYFTAYEVDSHADPRIVFDSTTQALEILKWQTVPPSGDLVVEKPRAFNQVTPDALGRAPDYAAVQEMVCAHLGMEEGAVAEREYVVRDRVVCRDGLSGIEYFQSRLPVRVKEIRITVPAGTDLEFASVGCEPSYDRESTGGRIIHRWRMEDLPSAAPRTVQGNERDCLPHLVYSTTGSWGDLAQDWLDRIGACTVLTGRLEEELEEIADEAQDESEQARLIHDAVLQGIRSVDYDFPLLESKCRPAGVVYESGYGHGLDKAVLLLTWLEQAGIDAEPVLVSRSLRFAEDVPCFEQVPEVWVAAWVDERAIWMNPLHSLSSAGRKDLDGRSFLRCEANADLEILPEPEVEENTCFLKVEAKVDKDGGLEGHAKLKMTGVFSPYYAVSGVEDETEHYVEIIVSGLLGGVEVESFNLRELTESTVILGFRFRREAGEEQKDLLLELPAVTERVEIPGFSAISTDRRVALILPAAFTGRVDVKIEKPEAMTIEHLPKATSIRESFGSYHLTCEEREGTIRVRRLVEVNRRRIEPVEYPKFRKFILEDRNPANATIVLGME